MSLGSYLNRIECDKAAAELGSVEAQISFLGVNFETRVVVDTYERFNLIKKLRLRIGVDE